MKNQLTFRLSTGKQDFLIVFLILFLAYLLSLPRTVVLEDDGLFLMAAWFNGIAHPPGYPLYTLLSHFATWVPLGSVAFRVHTLTALFAALGCGVLYLLLARVTGERTIAICTSVIFGLSPVYWSQAIIAEVYSLNSLIFIVLFLLSIIYIQKDDKEAKGIAALIGLIYGAGLSNHWPLILLSTPALIIILAKVYRRVLDHLIYFVPFAFIGLLPYLWMIFRSRMDPEISFYGPINTISEFWFVISRQGYSYVDNNISADYTDKINYFGFVIQESILQFGIFGSLLILVGLICQRKKISSRMSFALIVAYLFNTFVLVLLLNFDYDYLHQNIFRVYPVIAYSILVIWLAIGVNVVVDTVSKSGLKYLNPKIIKFTILFLTLASTLSLSVAGNWRSNEIESELYAKMILYNLAPQSSLLLNNDFNISPVGYMHKVENYRQDVELFQSYGLLFRNRLLRGDNKVSDMDREKIINNYINQTGNEIYYDTLPEYEYAVEEYGLFSRVDKSARRGEYKFIFSEDIISYFVYTQSRDDIVNPWVQILYKYHQRDFCYLLSGLSEYTLQADKKILFNNLIERFCNGYYGSIGLVKRMLLDDELDSEQANKIIKSAISNIEQSVTKEDMSVIYNFQGLVYLSTGDGEKATKSLKNSLEIWNHPDNDAHQILDSTMNAGSKE